MKARLLRNSYRPSKPLPPPNGTTIQCEAHFDKSSHNPVPTKEVRWGDQRWEEMMVGFYSTVEVLAPSEQ